MNMPDKTVSRIEVTEFLGMAGEIPVVDVRSPSEYLDGHIPGAVNIPLFNDEERALVGTLYKKEGRVPAIVEGYRLSGPTMSRKLEEALRISVNNSLLVHCWRGGMRSEAMAWLFETGGIRTRVLEGGYKAYRNHILDRLALKRKIIILGGMTGSGKTQLLHELRAKGEQVVDLEMLACHRGSAFGSLGQAPQPTTEHFANILFDNCQKLDPDRPVWLEDESRNIGSVFIPEGFFSNMQEAPVIAIMMDQATRMPRLLKEYSLFPAGELKISLLKISRRMGGDRTREALDAIDSGNIGRAVEIALDYYDKAYMFGLGKKIRKDIIYVKTDTDDTEVNSSALVEASRKIKW